MGENILSLKKYSINYTFIILFIFIVCSFINPQASTIYEKNKSAIVYIEVAVFLDEKYSSDNNIYQKIEKEYEKKILNTYEAMSSGSGFFLTKDGYCVTNNHVIDTEDELTLRKQLFNYMMYDFFSQIPLNVITNQEYDMIRNDIKVMINKSKIYIRILVNNKKYYEAKVVYKDKDLDVAILKINPEHNLRFITLADSDKIKVGNTVISIGYPLPSLLTEEGESLTATLTTGLISSIRDNNWGLQHTASINPGNSGGPLLNNNGEAIGINVRLITNANDIYFAIPINKFSKWLKEKDAVLLKKCSFDK